MFSVRSLAAIAVVLVLVAAPSAAARTHRAAAPLTGTVSLVDHAWMCQGPVNLASVTVLIKTAQIDAVHLGPGCTGTIGQITIVQYHGDGIKIGPGAHDLTIQNGSIHCYAHDAGKHQDGIQAMGGQRVTFHGLDDQCSSANNSAMFINEGAAGRELPTDIVCDGCTLSGGGFPVRIGLSLRSGVRNSHVCAGHFGGVRISPGIAQSPIDTATSISPVNTSISSCSPLIAVPVPNPAAGGGSAGTSTTPAKTPSTPQSKKSGEVETGRVHKRKHSG